MESAKQAVNYVSETVQGAISGASKETNKEVAKDSNVAIGTRYVPPYPSFTLLPQQTLTCNSASAAKDALGDKMDETTHDNKAEAHKQYAKA